MITIRVSIPQIARMFNGLDNLKRPPQAIWKTTFNKVGKYLSKYFRQRFKKEGAHHGLPKWKPLAPGYAMLKRCSRGSSSFRFSKGGHKVFKRKLGILTSGGRKLIRSFTNRSNPHHYEKVSVSGQSYSYGSKLWIAKVHHGGATIPQRVIMPKKGKTLAWINPDGSMGFSKGHALKASKIPARPITKLSRRSRKYIGRLFEKAVELEVKRGINSGSATLNLGG